MTEDILAQLFEENRGHLRAVAYRVLGSAAEADDAVQEAWLRLSRSDTSGVDNFAGWLTTVVARISLDMLRARSTREQYEMAPAPVTHAAPDPAEQAEMADSVGLALLVVLDTLAPAERLAFVLHDLFAMPFEEIAPIVGKSPAAARQLASRARRRVRGATAPPDVARQRALVTAFLAAAKEGDFSGLLAVLDPSVELRLDDVTAAMGGASPATGPDAVASVFSGRAKAVRAVLLDGVPGLVWQLHGEVKVAFVLSFSADRITAIEMVGDPDRLAGLEVETL